MLTENQVKAELSVSYIHAVAAICHYSCEHTRVDSDSIDVTIKSNGFITTGSIIRSPEIQIQLKASENLSLDASSRYIFDLPVKNYEDLRANTLTPRLLVALNLPNVKANWLTHSVNDLIIRNCAFWLNLKGLPQTSNTTAVRVFIPQANIFSPASLVDLMTKVSMQQPL